MTRPVDCFVERSLLVQLAGSCEYLDLAISVFPPEWVEEGTEAKCRIKLVGALDVDQSILGVDPMDALGNALKFLRAFLVSDDSGSRYFWPSRDPYVGDPDSLRSTD